MFIIISNGNCDTYLSPLFYMSVLKLVLYNNFFETVWHWLALWLATSATIHLIINDDASIQRYTIPLGAAMVQPLIMAQMDRITPCFQVDPLNRKYCRIPCLDITRQIQMWHDIDPI